MTALARGGRFAAIAVIGVWALALQACAVADQAAGECSADSDCVPGLKCYENRFCVAASVADTPVLVRVTPPSDSGLVVEEFNVTLTGASQNETRRFALTEPAVIHGSVTRKGAIGVNSIPGTLLATAPSDVEGRELSFQAPSYQVQKSFAGAKDMQGYELRVQKGHTYDLTFWPESEEIPPHYSSLTAGDSIEHWDIVLPNETTELRTIQGRVLAGKDQPVVGLRVWLRDDAGRQWSTRGKTDQSGRYRFVADPTAPRAHLVFAPDPAANATPGALLPSGEMQQPLDVTAVQAELPDIHLPALPPPVLTRIAAQGPDGAAIAGAAVHVQAAIADLPGEVTLVKLFVSVQSMTDAHGFALLQVPNLHSHLSIVPPPKSAAARIDVADVVLPTGDKLFKSVARGRVTGTVRDFASREVAGTRVTLRQVEAEEAHPAADGDEATFAVEPDASGAFALWVDPGRYAVWVEPPPGANLARVLARIDDVNADSAANPWRLVLPPPMVLAGEVRSQSGGAVAGVQIDVLAVKVQTPQGTRRPGGTPDDRLGKRPSGTVVLDSHLLGSALSAADGRFEVLLAPGQVAAE